MDVLDVPRQNAVKESVEDQHHHYTEQVVLVALNRGNMDVTPLHTNALYLIVGEVLCTETKRSG